MDKLFNFFIIKYSENLKYNNSFTTALRLFFERTTKINATISNLGNVYRNSKWTDLKILTKGTYFEGNIHDHWNNLKVLVQFN